MIKDSLDSFFENLPDQSRYPGGKAPRRPGVPKKAKALDESWDKNPTVKYVKGVATEFFTIGDLAKAINRLPVTIRSWESKGRLPLSRYRTQAPESHPIEGKTPMGRRLYTRHQIEVVIAAAEKAGVTDPDVRRPNWQIFTNEVVDGWKKTS